ncbi:MAG: hypothetical protein PHR06_02595 [Candidatus Cloacimonetes bacterium]|nr:hypothetical protein [Candidatus Cloacimonadota bacterium]
MKKIIVVILMIVLFSCHSGNNDFSESLRKLVEMEKVISKHFPFEKIFYPIAIINNGNQYYYTYSKEKREYSLISVKKSNIKENIGLRAAFPLKEADYKTVCAINSDAFKSQKEMVLIFHEFVHCAQSEKGEAEIKKDLQIYKTAMDKRDFMWELNYKFPYSDKQFETLYEEMMIQLESGELSGAIEKREEIKKILTEEEFEYMTWQEWKEGYARYVENKVLRAEFNSENSYGRKSPFNRITFYAGGERLIRCLIEEDNNLETDLIRLWEKIRGSKYF